jgi:6-phosphogluconolactonase
MKMRRGKRQNKLLSCLFSNASLVNNFLMPLHSSTQRTGTIATIVSRTIAVIIAAAMVTPAVWGKECLVYFGTFTDGKGIYVSWLDQDSGKLSAPQLAAPLATASSVAVSPDGRFLYAVSHGPGGDFVESFAIDGQMGSLKLLDKKSAGGVEPCYVGADAAGRNLFTADYVSGTVKSFHVNPDGTLVDGTVIQHHGHSVDPDRQKSAHAHCFVSAPGGRFALACDLGLDQVMVYRVNTANAALTHNFPPFATLTPGSGPRHLAFSPDGKRVCVISEMACTATVFDWDGLNGTLTAQQTVPLLPPGLYQKTFTAAEIAYGADGKYVYATVRGPIAPGANTISVLAVDPANGNLSLVQNISCDGNFPRGLGIDPSGHWLIIGNQKSGTITVFSINADTGKLTPTGQVQDAGSAVDVKFAPIQ